MGKKRRASVKENARIRVAKTNIGKLEIDRSKKIFAQRNAEVKGRSELQYSKKTKQAAKARQTRLINADVLRPAKSSVEGEQLKKGIEGMGHRAALDDERMEKLERMDPDKLKSMYDSNELLFEVFFNYGGIKETEYGAYQVEDQKIQEIDWFIGEYERTWGALI